MWCQLLGSTHGVLVKASVPVDLRDLDNDANARFGDGARAVAVNASEFVVGWSYNVTMVGQSPFKRPVAWQNGQIRDLGMLPHPTTGYDDVEAPTSTPEGRSSALRCATAACRRSRGRSRVAT